MSKDFNWQTDDKTDWDDPADERPESQPLNLAAWFKRHSRLLGVFAALLLIAALVIYGILSRRVEEAEDTTESAVLAAHGLVRQAAFQKDFDLLSAMMVGDAGWAAAQLELLNLGLFIDRRPLGLRLAREEAAQTVKPGSTLTVTLSPDFQTAEVVELFPYTITGGEHLSDTVWLEQTFSYRRQGESWLLRPLPDDEQFWGRWQNYEEREYLTLVYPRRDEEFALFLASRLNALAGRICRDEVIECPADFHLEIRLSRGGESLLSLNESIFNIFLTQNLGRYHFTYPAPTLAGRPVDAAGQEALFRGYANWLAAVMAFRFGGDGQGGRVVSRTFDETLAGWGLERPPEPAVVLPIPQPITPPPIPFPEQDILLTCHTFRDLAMLRYNPRANSWSDELSGRQTTPLSLGFSQFEFSLMTGMTALPDDSGVLLNVNHFEGAEEPFNLVLWRDGQEQLWLESDFALQLPNESIQLRFDPGGRNLVIFETVDSTTSFQLIPYAVNIEDCLSGSCELVEYEGFPYWSPDPSWLLIVDREDQDALALWNTGTGEETALGAGYSPVWVDDETFVYLRAEGEPAGGLETPSNVQMVEAAVSSPLSGTVLFESADIANVINLISSAVQDGTPDQLFVSQAIVHPQQPDWLFLTATLHPSTGRSSNYLLSYRRDTGDMALLMALAAGLPAGVIEVVQDGRYLAVPVYGETAGGSGSDLTLTLLPLDPETMTVGSDIETYELTEGFSHDWSRDGRWLLVIKQDEFHLIAPGHTYDQTIPHNLDQYCEAAWVNAPSS